MEILPPKHKLKIEFPAYEPPPEPPPLRCVLCEEVRPDYHFGFSKWRAPGCPICWDCRPSRGRRAEYWLTVRPSDIAFIDDVEAAVRALEIEERCQRDRSRTDAR